MSLATRRPLALRALVVALLAVVLSACQHTWGVRESYRNYIAGPIAKGEIVVSDGAGHLDGSGPGKGPFSWKLTSSQFNPANTTGWVQLDGTVVTRGHRHSNGTWILDTTFRDPLLIINGTTGLLVVDLEFRPFVGTNPNPIPPLQTINDAWFATVDLSGVSWTPNAEGKRTISNAPMVGLDATMQQIGWDDFYGSPVTLDPLSTTF